MAGDNGKIKVKSPARQLADIAAEYFRPSGLPKSYANDAVEVHAVNLERRLTEAVDELITSRDFVIGELVKALDAAKSELHRLMDVVSGDDGDFISDTLAEIEAALTAAGRKR